MAKTRLMLHSQLKEFVNNVYFSPPTGLHMDYPCIKYNLVNQQTDSADNIKYIVQDRYSLTLIDPDPDSVIKDKILKLPYCSLDRPYTANNLNHFVFTLYW